MSERIIALHAIVSRLEAMGDHPTADLIRQWIFEEMKRGA